MVNPEADGRTISNEAGADALSFFARTNRLIEFLRKAEAAEVDDMADRVDEVDENKKTEREKRKKILQSFEVIHQEISELQKTRPDSTVLGTVNAIMSCVPPDESDR
jgi:hypothetical protein